MTRSAHEPGPALSVLLQGIAPVPTGADRHVTGIGADSRTITPGSVFLALPGQRDHGLHHVTAAARAGAAAVLVDAAAGDVPDLPRHIPVLRIPGLVAAAGILAARFHDHPSRSMDVIGVTGTNGKTSTTHYIATALDAFSGGHAGLIGTLGYGPVGRLRPSHLTTPDAIGLQAELARQRDEGVRHVAMEVSSHGLVLDRLAGTRIRVAVFTNLTRDHLDFHGDMAAYGAAKRRLFEYPELSHAVLNLDDPFGRELRAHCADRVPVTGYRLVDGPLPATLPAGELVGAWRDAAAGAIDLELRGCGGQGRLQAALTGRFNASNLLAACATLRALDVPFGRALEILAQARAVAGRMEAFRAHDRPLVVVDYAHTPDALAQALAALRPQCRGRLVCVFGCGGDRDPGKRPQMGAVAESGADLVVITSDNPRSEDPGAIIGAIRAGMTRPDRAVVEPDRAAAVARAIRAAAADDIVLVAGKGHETTQEIRGRKHPFSDRQLARTLLGLET